MANGERAPALYELHANGPHDPTRPYLIGILNAQREKAVWTHVSLRFASGPEQEAASVCSTADSRNYLAEFNTGRLVDDGGRSVMVGRRTTS